MLHHSYLALRNDVLFEACDENADILLSTSLRVNIIIIRQNEMTEKTVTVAIANQFKRLLHRSYLALRNDVLFEGCEEYANMLLSTSLRGTKQSQAENVSLVGTKQSSIKNVSLVGTKQPKNSNPNGLMKQLSEALTKGNPAQTISS